MQNERKKAPRRCAGVVAALVLGPGAGAAHHSFIVYDTDTVSTFRGTVTRYEWTNPHVYLFVEVEDAAGGITEWALEGESTALMGRAGWSPTTLAPGDRISARVNRNRNPNRLEARILSLSTPDGRILGRRATNTAAPAVGAAGLAGVWDALRDYADFEFVRGALTKRGAAAVRAFDERASPVQDCLAFPAPVVTFLPYRSEIELADDRIYIRSEYFSVERIVFMDGRGHPENGERTEQGHSIGWWDDDALVVDTTLFADHPIGNFRGLPSGGQKHVVERFELSEDRRQIHIALFLEDPEYMAAPWTGEIVWDYVPDGEMLPFECDPEVARRFATQ